MPSLARGTCIGRYVVVEQIGAGGMGVVYRAYDPELDRRIALKVVRQLDDASEDRLLREAQAMARVAHPNIIAVHDVGTFEGAVFIAMELVEGQTLAAWRKAAKRGRRDIVEVFIAAGRGLAAAHAAGIIHRDFKPANVILGDDGRVRVLDFGLARAGRGDRTPGSELTPLDLTPRRTSGLTGSLDAATTEPPQGRADITPPIDPATRTASTVVEIPVRDLDAETILDDHLDLPRAMASRVMGTPTYMAPEQRRIGAYDARVDQYAFAVALYETLYGERPFDGATHQQLADNAAEGRVRPPAKGSDVPAWLRKVLVRALAPAPEDRHPSMDVMLAALAADPVARRRRLALIAVAVIAVIALGFGLSRRRAVAARPCRDAEAHLAGTWDPTVASAIERAFLATGRPHAADSYHRVADALGQRARAWVDMRTAACQATHVRGEQSAALLDLRMACLDRRLAGLRALTVELGRGPDPELLNRALDAVDDLDPLAGCADRDALTSIIPPPDDPALARRVEAIRDELAGLRAKLWGGHWREARDRAVAAVAEARAVGYLPLIAEALSLAGDAHGRVGDNAAAEAALYEAAQAASAAHDDNLAATVWIELVGLVGYDEARADAGLALSKAAAAAVARAGDDDGRTADLLHATSLARWYAADYDAALVDEQRALAIRERLVGADDPQVAEAINEIARIKSAQGKYAEAETMHRRALEIRERVFGVQHPAVAESLSNLGVVTYHQGRLTEARDLHLRALAMRQATLGPDHVDVAASLNNLAGVYLDLGDAEAAEVTYQKALTVWEHALGLEHPDLAIPLSNLGDLANARGDHALALARCTRAAGLEAKAMTADNPDLAWNLTCIGEAQVGLGDHAGALVPLERALTLRSGAPGDARELARTQLALARALWRARPAERVRAVELATAARETLRGVAGASWKQRLAGVEAWLGGDR